MITSLFDQLPSWLTILLCTATSIIISLAILYSIKAIFPIEYGKELSIIVKNLLTFRLQGSITLILGFAIVMSNSSIQNSRSGVFNEAFYIERLHNETAFIDKSSAKKINTALENYIRSILDKEWPTMSTGNPYTGDLTTKKYLQELSASLNLSKNINQNANINFSNLNQAFEQIALARQARLTIANQNIPEVFWALIIIFFIIVNCIGALLEFDGGHYNLLFMMTYAAITGVLIGFLLVMQHPFAGDVSVSSGPLRQVLIELQANEQ